MSRPAFQFRLTSSPTSPVEARAGLVTTAHGSFETPAFMPVGTLATVKTLLPEEVAATGAGILLVNAYHLYRRPGHELVARMGGVHRFMDGPWGADVNGWAKAGGSLFGEISVLDAARRKENAALVDYLQAKGAR